MKTVSSSLEQNARVWLLLDEIASHVVAALLARDKVSGGIFSLPGR